MVSSARNRPPFFSLFPGVRPLQSAAGILQGCDNRRSIFNGWQPAFPIFLFYSHYAINPFRFLGDDFTGQSFRVARGIACSPSRVEISRETFIRSDSSRKTVRIMQKRGVRKNRANYNEPSSPLRALYNSKRGSNRRRNKFFATLKCKSKYVFHDDTRDSSIGD